MDLWVPLVLGLFKVGVLITVICFSIKSHRDGEKEQKRKNEANAEHPPAANVADGAAPALKVDA